MQGFFANKKHEYSYLLSLLSGIYNISLTYFFLSLRLNKELLSYGHQAINKRYMYVSVTFIITLTRNAYRYNWLIHNNNKLYKLGMISSLIYGKALT